MCKIAPVLVELIFLISIFLLFLFCRIPQINVAYSVLQSDIFFLVISQLFFPLRGLSRAFLQWLFHIFIIGLSLGCRRPLASLLFLDFTLVDLLFVLALN